MSGLKTNAMSRKDVLAAVRAIPVKKNFVWDGKTEDDRPATEKELLAGVAAYRSGRGRPKGSGTKEQVAVRFDRDVLAAGSGSTHNTSLAGAEINNDRPAQALPERLCEAHAR